MRVRKEANSRGVRLAAWGSTSSAPGCASGIDRTCSAISAGPPRRTTTIHASTIEPVIPATNWSRSVTTTPHRPDATV